MSPTTPRRRRHLAAAIALALTAAACGGAPTPSVEGGDEGSPRAIAPECSELDDVPAQPPEDAAPTGTSAEAIDDVPLEDGQAEDGQREDGAPEGEPGAAPAAEPGLATQIEAWGGSEAAESFAGVWIDQDIDGIVVAFADDVEHWAEQARDRFDPGLAIAEASSTAAELDRVQQDLRDDVSANALPGDLGPDEAGTDEAADDATPEPGSLLHSGTDLMRNRVSVGIFEPDEQRLADLTDRHGEDMLCFEITRMPDEEDAQPAPFVPDGDPDPDSASIDVLVNEQACAGGQSAEDRIAEPEIDASDDAVTVTMRVVPRPGPQDCPGNPDTPYTLELDEPLGDRELLDGSESPPATPEGDW